MNLCDYTKELVIIVTIIFIAIVISQFALGMDVINYVDDHGVVSGQQQYWSIPLRSVDNVSGILWFDSGDDSLLINGCSRYYYQNISFTGEVVKTVKISFVAYEPLVYNFLYGVNSTNGSLLFNDSFLLYVNGNSYNWTNLTINASNCLLYSVPHRVKRYGFNTSVNLPLERLRNHTIIPPSTNKTTTSMNVTFINKSIIFPTTNITLQNVSDNVSYHTFTKEDLNLENYYVVGFGFDVIMMIIVIVIGGIVCIVGYLFFMDKENR